MVDAGSLWRGGVSRFWRITLAASATLLSGSTVVGAEELTLIQAEPPFQTRNSGPAAIRWTPVETQSSSTSSQPQWQEITPHPDRKVQPVVWTPVDPSMAAEMDNRFEEEAPIQDPRNAAVAIKPPRMPTGPTHASRRTLWRDDAWLPQITSIIPNGFGPSGLMLELSATGTDCTLGKGPCEPFSSFEAWQDSITKQANGEIYGTIGIGNSQKGVGSFLITNSFEQVAAEVRNSSISSTPLTRLQTGLHYARALGPDTSLRSGIENLIT